MRRNIPLTKSQFFRHAATIAVICLLAIQTLVAWADSLSLPRIITERGKTIQMPLTLNTTTDLAAASLRLTYDPTVVDSLQVQRGTLAKAGVLMEVFAPETGKLNLLFLTESGKSVFSPRSGVLANLVIKIRADAPLNKWSAIGFAPEASDPFAFPGSSLSNLSGQQIFHQQAAGAILVSQALQSQENWSLYE
jgi:hypothetical protein